MEPVSLATVGNEHAHFVPNGATYRHKHEHACADFDSHPGYCHCHPYIDANRNADPAGDRNPYRYTITYPDARPLSRPGAQRQ